MGRRIALLCVLTLALGAIASRLTSQPGNKAPYETVQKKYLKNWNSIYLMHPTLWGMQSNLKNPVKYKSVTQRHAKASIDLFAKFLADYLFRKNTRDGESYMDSLAFVQLNLAIWQAGYKYNTDGLPEITTLSWTESDVQEISVYADEYLSNTQEVAVQVRAISSGKMPLDTAWGAIEKAKKNPYLSDQDLVPVLTEFKIRVDKAPTKEMRDLQIKDPQVHREINTFNQEMQLKINQWNQETQLNGEWFKTVRDASQRYTKSASDVEHNLDKTLLLTYLKATDQDDVRLFLPPRPDGRYSFAPDQNGSVYRLLQSSIGPRAGKR